MFENGLQEDGTEECNQLLMELRRNPTIVRIGDVYALMLKYAENIPQAREL